MSYTLPYLMQCYEIDFKYILQTEGPCGSDGLVTFLPSLRAIAGIFM